MVTDEKKPRSVVREILSWVILIAVAIIAATFINSVIIVNATVPTGSMENTIMSHTRLVAWRLSYTFSEPERLDVIVFESPDGEDVLYVKRIIGMPGERIDIIGGQVFVDGNGTPEYEWYLKEEPHTWLEDQSFQIPEGHFFVMGDNRNDSKDSRGLGWQPWESLFIPEDNILGRAAFSYWPLNRIGIIR